MSRNSVCVNGVGRSHVIGAFKAISRGYNHWASGKIDRHGILTLLSCAIYNEAINESRQKPSTLPWRKPGIYSKGYLWKPSMMSYLSIRSIMNMQLSPNRKAASCTHISALLHHNINACFWTSRSIARWNEQRPDTTYPCIWNVPRTRKDSTLRVSETHFEKHDYRRMKKAKHTSVHESDTSR